MYNKTKAARQALLAYMEWWSETTFSAGWLHDLPGVMSDNYSLTKKYDFGFRFLVESAGGWFIYDRKFIKGTWEELCEEGSGE